MEQLQMSKEGNCQAVGAKDVNSQYLRNLVELTPKRLQDIIIGRATPPSTSQMICTNNCHFSGPESYQ
jgi:hypothetical protein